MARFFMIMTCIIFLGIDSVDAQDGGSFGWSYSNDDNSKKSQTTPVRRSDAGLNSSHPVKPRILGEERPMTDSPVYHHDNIYGAPTHMDPLFSQDTTPSWNFGIVREPESDSTRSGKAELRSSLDASGADSATDAEPPRLYRTERGPTSLYLRLRSSAGGPFVRRRGTVRPCPALRRTQLYCSGIRQGRLFPQRHHNESAGIQRAGVSLRRIPRPTGRSGAVCEAAMNGNLFYLSTALNFLLSIG